MSTITVRNMDEGVQRLKRSAAPHNRCPGAGRHDVAGALGTRRNDVVEHR